MSKININDVRKANISLVFMTIRRNAPISRADISKITRLTRSTVSSLVSDLINMGFVKEIGSSNNKNVGKKATMLDICTDRIFFISVMLTEYVISVARMNLQGEITKILKEKVVTSSDVSMIDIIIRQINELWASAQADNIVYYGIGVSVPAPIKKGLMMASASFKSLIGFNLFDILSKEFDCPVHLNNNADAAALGEKWFGNYYNVDTLAFIIIDQGIGCGVVINDELFIGENGLSNEFGHTVIGKKGYTNCFCGNPGCLSSFASDRALASLLIEEEGDEKIVSVVDDIMKIEVNVLNDRLQNNKKYNKAVNSVAEMLGIGLANLINMLSADLVVVEGSICHIKNFIEKVEQSCVEHIHAMYFNSYSIKKSQLGSVAPLIGASAFLYKDLCMNPYLIANAKVFADRS